MNFRPGDLIEALEHNLDSLPHVLGPVWKPLEWYGVRCNESPVIERIQRRYGVFWLSLERLYCCKTAPSLRKRVAPSAFKVLKGQVDVGITRLTTPDPQLTSRFRLGPGSFYEQISDLDATYLQPITTEAAIIRIWFPGTKPYIESALTELKDKDRDQLGRLFKSILKPDKIIKR